MPSLRYTARPYLKTCLRALIWMAQVFPTEVFKAIQVSIIASESLRVEEDPYSTLNCICHGANGGQFPDSCHSFCSRERVLSAHWSH